MGSIFPAWRLDVGDHFLARGQGHNRPVRFDALHVHLDRAVIAGATGQPYAVIAGRDVINLDPLAPPVEQASAQSQVGVPQAPSIVAGPQGLAEAPLRRNRDKAVEVVGVVEQLATARGLAASRTEAAAERVRSRFDEPRLADLVEKLLSQPICDGPFNGLGIRV
jgi:hypothetical protein